VVVVSAVPSGDTVEPELITVDPTMEAKEAENATPPVLLDSAAPSMATVELELSTVEVTLPLLPLPPAPVMEVTTMVVI